MFVTDILLFATKYGFFGLLCVLPFVCTRPAEDSESTNLLVRCENALANYSFSQLENYAKVFVAVIVLLLIVIWFLCIFLLCLCWRAGGRHCPPQYLRDPQNAVRSLRPRGLSRRGRGGTRRGILRRRTQTGNVTSEML